MICIISSHWWIKCSILSVFGHFDPETLPHVIHDFSGWRRLGQIDNYLQITLQSIQKTTVLHPVLTQDIKGCILSNSKMVSPISYNACACQIKIWNIMKFKLLELYYIDIHASLVYLNTIRQYGLYKTACYRRSCSWRCYSKHDTNIIIV